MADKEVKDAKAENQSWFSTGAPGRGWLFAILGFFVLLTVFFAGLGLSNHNRWFDYGPRDDGIGYGRGYMDYGDMPMTGRFGDYANSQSRVIGVVTSASDSNFTVAGNGTTTKVTTDGSTQYQGGNQVKVNDTVVVTGSDNNGTLTANNIIINP